MLRDGDSVAFMSQINGEGEIIIATSEGKFKKVISSQIEPTGRYKKGSIIVGLREGDYVLSASYVTKPYPLAVVQKNNAVSELSSEDIPIAMQSAKAVSYTHLGNREYMAESYGQEYGRQSISRL